MTLRSAQPAHADPSGAESSEAQPAHADPSGSESAEAQQAPRLASRIPSLDGLRALSIGLVFLTHMIGTRNYPIRVIGRFEEVGNLGVRIFFVISGFLITSLLLEEEARTGRISLRRFYIRRFFRIFPAFYVFAGALFVLGAANVIALHSGDLLSMVTFTANYDHDHSWYIGHTWSLSVEEQFYLLWPAVLLFVGARRGLRAALAVVALAPLFRFGMGMFPSLRPGIGMSFPSVADALATGCVLAGIRPWLSRSPGFNRFFQSPAFWVVPVVVVAAIVQPSTKFDWLVGQTAMNIGIAFIVERSIRRPHDWFGRILNTRPLVFIGTLSYSLYLWQQLFLFGKGDAVVQSFPLNMIVAVAVALASYYIIERPFLRLRVRLEARAAAVSLARRPHYHVARPPGLSFFRRLTSRSAVTAMTKPGST